MRIKTTDEKRIIDIGEEEIWYSIYSTAEKRLGISKHKMPLAIAFLKNCKCTTSDALETARQFNLLRDEFSQISLSKVVFDMRDMKKEAPWKNNVSPVVTSGANLFTTSDGKDLLFEVVSILTYAHYVKVDVNAEK